MVVDQLSTQRFCARTTCTLMPLLLLSPEPKWLSNTLNSASPCAPRPSLSASARRPFVDGSPAPNRPASPSACTIIPPGLFPSHAKTSSQLEAQILALRRQRRSYAQIRMVLPVSKATLSRVLRRHHLNRLSALEPPKPPALRYERAAPGDLLHLDIKKLGRFHRPGVRATGDRTHRNPGAGVESLHVAIDDHSRLAFACLLPDERTPRALHALPQAVCFYSAHGIKIQQVLTDRGSTYRSKPFASACHQLGLQHLFTKPYRPQTNGKAERFIQTITREWAYARPYNSSNHRATFLTTLMTITFTALTPPCTLSLLPPDSP